MSRIRPDLYISADVEADGPVPGRYSMLSFGFCVAGELGDGGFVRHDPEERTFYRELRPISAEWEPSAVDVANLDRGRLLAEGTDPAVAMRDAERWVDAVSAGARPVFVAWPLGFDWLFVQWYFETYLGRSPFGFGSALDVKTMLQVKTGRVLDELTRDRTPADVASVRPHPHHALDDAIEQADVFANVMEWPGVAGAGTG